MAADLFLGSLTILSMAAIVIFSLTTTRSRNQRDDADTTLHVKANGEEKDE